VLIVTDGGDDNTMDHADWAGARLIGSSSLPPAAPGSFSAVSTGTASIAVTWTDNASNETGYAIERSTDGVNFAQIAALSANTKIFNDSGLAANSRYYYRVRATNSVGPSPYSTIASAVTANPASIKYVSDLTWASSSNGSGPVEKDMSNGGSGTKDGRTITLNGVTYAKGLGVNAISKVVYNLGGLYSTFLCDIGVDDEVGSSGSVVFQVQLDGKVVYDSGTMSGTTATKSVSINLGTARQLALIVNDNKDGKTLDHADWAGARLVLVGATSQTLAASGTTSASTVTKTNSLLTSSTKLLA
jgi:hypothetical protein